MKQTLVLIILFLSSVLTIKAQDTISYSYENKISWENFKGIPIMTDSAEARISTGIQMKVEKVNIWTGVSTFSAWGFVDQKNSWVKEGHKTDYVLNHEQLHFDISELMAKKLENYINSQKINGAAKGKATKIFNEYLGMLGKLQALYDLETSGKVDSEEQSKWDKKIRAELKELKQLSLTTPRKH